MATKDNIIAGFKSIAARAKPEDVFVFFYAGHGSLDEDHKDKDGDSPFTLYPPTSPNFMAILNSW